MQPFKRRLTANGPFAAYETFRSSQRTTDEDSINGIPATIDIGTPAERVETSQGPLRASLSGNCLEHERGSKTQSRGQDDRQTLPVRVDNSDGVGGRQADVPIPGAFDRLHYEGLKRQIKEYQQTVANLQKVQTSVLQKLAELPRHCQWEHVSKVLTDVVSSFLIGSEKQCTMYPTELQLIPSILAAFGVKMEGQQEETQQFLTEWGKGGRNSIMLRVFDNIRNRRGAVLRVLREEFYTQLGALKPRDGDTKRMDEWKRELAQLKRTKEWRVDVNDETIDPWGASAIHHSIARVLQGMRYDKAAAVTISIHQAGFLLYNLELAMDGRVMEASRMILHHKGMQEMEERIKKNYRDMKRVIILME